jgi:DNA mismatch repair protein MutL
MTIRLLSPTLVNRIAAGEVIERPASALKELVENALDAGATDIRVTIHNAGIDRIMVEDNGAGMVKDDLTLCVERHATSKLEGEDLLNITHLGFRGEALPSIASVSRLSIKSRAGSADAGWQLEVDAGLKGPTHPVAMAQGTTVEIKDLFYATPARLKFLKSPSTETSHMVDMMERLAMAHPSVGFRLTSEKRCLLRLPSMSGELFEASGGRLRDILGKDFMTNALVVDETYEQVRVHGHVGLPTFHKASSGHQFFFINNRPVKDRQLLGAIRGAYQDVLAHDRHAVLALFIDLPCELVDVNVHPAKAEVRFRDAGMVRNLVVGSIKRALAKAGHRASSTVASQMMGTFQRSGSSTWPSAQQTHFFERSQNLAFGSPAGTMSAPLSPEMSVTFAHEGAGAPAAMSCQTPTAEQIDVQTCVFPLGLAKAQLHNTYIISQTQDGLVITDQHAAHERLVYEQIKMQLGEAVAKEDLLLPEVVDLPAKTYTMLVDHLEVLKRFGLEVESFGQGALLVRAVPSMLKRMPVKALLEQMAEDVAEYGTTTLLEDALLRRLSTYACHHSIRAGQALSPQEMDALLRQMEATPLSGQCNHGRPTHVTLTLNDIERLFGRK